MAARRMLALLRRRMRPAGDVVPVGPPPRRVLVSETFALEASPEDLPADEAPAAMAEAEPAPRAAEVGSSDRFACALHASYQPTAADFAADRWRPGFTRFESTIARQLVRSIVSKVRCANGPCPRPRVAENARFRWSLSFDREEPKVIRINPFQLQREATGYGVQRESNEYGEMLWGLVAHEVGHWYESEGNPQAISDFMTTYRGKLFTSSDRGSWVRELFADYYAGRFLAAHLLEREALQRFFRLVGGDGSDTHPPAERRVRAIDQGYQDQGQEALTETEKAALAAALR